MSWRLDAAMGLGLRDPLHPGFDAMFRTPMTHAEMRERAAQRKRECRRHKRHDWSPWYPVYFGWTRVCERCREREDRTVLP